MIYEEAPLQAGPDPLSAVLRLLHWSLGVALHAGIGVFAGLLLAALMRRRGLHWSWTLPGLAGSGIARLAITGAALTVLVVALLAAALRGRRRHRRDLELGADFARAAAAQRGPADTLRRALRGLSGHGPKWLEPLGGGLARLIDADTGESWLARDRLVLGTDAHERPVAIPLGGVHGGTHTLVVGASGSGKTVTQIWLATRAVERGMGLVVLDPKGDPDLRAAVGGAARGAARAFIQWTPMGPMRYNPYARGGDSEIADKVLAGERFTEPHYLRQAQRYLGHEVRALRGLGEQVSLAGLAHYLDPDQLELLARRLEPGPRGVLQDYLDSLTARQRADLSGVRDRLAIVAESDVAAWLEPAAGTDDAFALLEAVRQRAVVYFGLESDRRPLIAQMLGGAIVQDLQTTVAALQAEPVATLVLIDEFSALAAEQVARLFGRARSAGVSLVLGTQELADLRLPGREQLLDQVLGNLTALVAHRQVVPASAQEIAQIAGSEGTWRTSWASDGRSQRTRTHEYRLRPDDLGSLERGQAAVVVLAEAGATRLAHIRAAARDG